MSRVFSTVFCFTVCFLVVYNVLVMFPSVRKYPSSRAAVKYGTILITATIAQLVFRPRPKVAAVPAKEELTLEQLNDLNQWTKRPGV